MRLIPDDGRIKIFDNNICIGYVENETLYGFDHDGYAVEIGPVENSAIEQLKKWLNSK